MNGNAKHLIPALSPERRGSEVGGSAAAEPFIVKAEVAKRLGKKPRTVDDWMKRGILPFYKIGHSVVFRWSEVQAHFERSFRVSRRGR